MPTAVSAPGKVLFAGGYLALDRAFTGLVFALDARMHVVVDDIDTTSGVELAEIDVRSPQFPGAAWNYGYHDLPENDGGVEVVQLQGSPSTARMRNVFIEVALAYALTYISTVSGANAIKAARVRILADDGYYSDGPISSAASEDNVSRRFRKFQSSIQDTPKTGLGSSAALVTAFVGAMLVHYLSVAEFDPRREKDRAILHNLAQAAHCAAQGKIGSGFDVAAAVYGTHVYRRFSPAILESIGEIGSAGFAARLRAVVEEKDEQSQWDTEIARDAVTIPMGVELVLCDVHGGSQTVGMVRKVLQWRQSAPDESSKLWAALHGDNEKLADLLSQSTTDTTLTETLNSIRSRLREMSRSADVPIEPPEQTMLLDHLTDYHGGMYGGVVPGAGGYDAIALLVRDDVDTKARIQQKLTEWNTTSDHPVKLLGVRSGSHGIRLEDAALYEME